MKASFARPTPLVLLVLVAMVSMVTCQDQCVDSHLGQLYGQEQADLIFCLQHAGGWYSTYCGGRNIWTWGSGWQDPNEGWNRCRDCLVSAATSGQGEAKCDRCAGLGCAAHFAAGYYKP
ncbi:hypothetical protein CBR_g34994 [Chara braunii]|uniref:Secreted protein n=1 Tax=Chara braunii TaxID=69332 RepID=A0A388LJW7_CHABU|nr:hypothetical protein CBR_g34994 [Chara braunii]|eukprot:GBG82624.1 hypothetical protein CBR_g34994 [Chara braunii]